MSGVSDRLRPEPREGNSEFRSEGGGLLDAVEFPACRAWRARRCGCDWLMNMKGEIKITKRLVNAVEKDRCFSCGKHCYEACYREPCAREFHGGSRKATAKVIVLPVVRIER